MIGLAIIALLAIAGAMRKPRGTRYWIFCVAAAVWMALISPLLFYGGGTLETPEVDGIITRAVRAAAGDGPLIGLWAIAVLLAHYGVTVWLLVSALREQAGERRAAPVESLSVASQGESRNAIPDTPTAPPPKSQRIHWRNGVRRIFYALSAVYFLVWGAAGLSWTNDNPFILVQPPLPAREPLRQLTPLESQNPRVQQLLSLVSEREQGGIGFDRDLILRRAADRQRGYADDLPSWQSALIDEASRLYSAEGSRYVVLPNPNGDLVAYASAMTLSQLKMSLEQSHAGWRWPVRVDYSGICIVNGAGSCASSEYGADRPFPVNPTIHCQAHLAEGLYLSQRRLHDLLPQACGEFGQQLYDEAVERQNGSRSSFAVAFGVMVGIWLAVFAFGKVFWWIVDGFSGKRTRFDPTAG